MDSWIDLRPDSRRSHRLRGATCAGHATRVATSGRYAGAASRNSDTRTDTGAGTARHGAINRVLPGCALGGQTGGNCKAVGREAWPRRIRAHHYE
jgi:hypothetical protein